MFILLFSILATVAGGLKAFQCLVVSHEKRNQEQKKHFLFSNCCQRPNTRIEFTDRLRRADTLSLTTSVRTNLD